MSKYDMKTIKMAIAFSVVVFCIYWLSETLAIWTAMLMTIVLQLRLGHSNAVDKVIYSKEGKINIVIYPTFHGMWWFLSLCGGALATPDGKGNGIIQSVTWLRNSRHWKPILSHEIGHIVYDQDLGKVDHIVIDINRELRADRHAALMTSPDEVIAALWFIVRWNPMAWFPSTINQIKRREQYLRLFM